MDQPARFNLRVAPDAPESLAANSRTRSDPLARPDLIQFDQTISLSDLSGSALTTLRAGFAL
jgi:hypothetical protein